MRLTVSLIGSALASGAGSWTGSEVDSAVDGGEDVLSRGSGEALSCCCGMATQGPTGYAAQDLPADESVYGCLAVSPMLRTNLFTVHKRG